MPQNLKVSRLTSACLWIVIMLSGFLIYVNIALVQWFSRKQSTVETSVFGAEFVA